MQTTNIIHFPGLPLFRLEYKFTQFILVPGPSSRWRWHHRHLAGPARFGRSGPARSVRSGPFRSGPFRSGPVPSRVLTQTGAGNRCSSWCVLCAQGIQGGMQPRQPVWTRKVEIFSSGFISWLLFKIRFHFLPCWAIEHCPKQWKTRKGNSVESSHNLRHLKIFI